MDLQWTRVFRLFPVNYTHGPDGYWLGACSSARRRELPQRSRWFGFVETAKTVYGTTAYSPTPPAQE